jgi:hypothetical protein
LGAPESFAFPPEAGGDDDVDVDVFVAVVVEVVVFVAVDVDVEVDVEVRMGDPVLVGAAVDDVRDGSATGDSDREVLGRFDPLPHDEARTSTIEKTAIENPPALLPVIETSHSSGGYLQGRAPLTHCTAVAGWTSSRSADEGRGQQHVRAGTRSCESLRSSPLVPGRRNAERATSSLEHENADRDVDEREERRGYESAEAGDDSRRGKQDRPTDAPHRDRYPPPPPEQDPREQQRRNHVGKGTTVGGSRATAESLSRWVP